jgi:hypothetical protein
MFFFEDGYIQESLFVFGKLCESICRRKSSRASALALLDILSTSMQYQSHVPTMAIESVGRGGPGASGLWSCGLQTYAMKRKLAQIVEATRTILNLLCGLLWVLMSACLGRSGVDSDSEYGGGGSLDLILQEK